MSQVTNVVLQFSGADGDTYAAEEFGSDFENLDRVQEILRECTGNGQQFKYIVGYDDRQGRSTDSSANDFWGGSKVPETTILAGAFNYLPLEDFIEKLSALTWREPELFRLFVQEQDANAFGVWVIREGRIVCVVEQAME